MPVFFCGSLGLKGLCNIILGRLGEILFNTEFRTRKIVMLNSFTDKIVVRITKQDDSE